MSLLWIAVWIWLGFWCVRRFSRLTRLETAVFGTIFGLAVGGYNTLAWSYAFGLSRESHGIWLTIAILAACSTFLLKRNAESYDETLLLPPNRLRWWALGGGLFLLWFGLTTLTSQNDQLWIQNRHNYGDIRLHLAYIYSFVEGNNVPVQNPIMAGVRPSYPFLVDFITSELVLLGLPLIWAYNLMTVIGYGLIALSIYLLGVRLLTSKTQATLAVFFVFLGGGVGFFTQFIPEWSQHNWAVDYLKNAPEDYSIIKESGYWLGNSLLIFFNTQRTFLLGLPLTLMIIHSLYRLDRKSSWQTYVWIGLLIGLLPLIHTSSLLVLLFLMPLFLYTTWRLHSPKVWWRNWLALAITTLAIAVPLLGLFIDQTSSLTRLIHFAPGWMAEKGETFLTIWLKNGLFLIPAGIAGIILLYRQNQTAGRLLLASMILFIFANFVVTQPWNFDNSKYLLYWLIFMTYACATTTAWLWHHRAKAFALVLLIGLTASGTYDVARRVNKKTQWFPITASGDAAMVNEIQTIIPPKSQILTYGWMMSPMVFLSGRPMVFGDGSWIWSHGLEYQKRLQTVESIYSGDASALAHLTTLKVDYIVLSPHERQHLPNLNLDWLSQFPIVYNANQITIYDTTRRLGGTEFL